MLPAASEEQCRVLDHWSQGRNVSVSACCGAGKTTLLLHACRAFRDDPIVVVAYNAPLAHEMNLRLAEAGITNATAYTFHGLASSLFSFCPDDNTLHELVQEAFSNGAQPRRMLEVKHLLLDEMQDMKELFYRFLSLVVDVKSIHLMLVGDAIQMLYDFDKEDPALIKYLERPQDHFHSSWIFETLSVSFRLTEPLARLVNSMNDGAHVVAGNTHDPARPPLIMTMHSYEWTKKVVPLVLRLLQTTPIERIAILARSVRPTNASIRRLINELARKGVEVYVHGHDAPDTRVRTGKLTVSTFHASKGLTFLATIVLGVGHDSEHNPIHVALSRASRDNIVVCERRNPPRRLIDAIRNGELQCTACPLTKELVRHGVPDSAEDDAIYEPCMRVATLPRGRCEIVHRSIGEATCSLLDETDAFVADHIVALDGGKHDDVSDLLLLGALMAEEHRITGRCKMLQHMLDPHRSDAKEHTSRVRARAANEEHEGDDGRFVEKRARETDLLPDYRILHTLASTPPTSDHDAARAWCMAAASAKAFGSFHHRLRNLRAHGFWVDVESFVNIRQRLRDRLFDAWTEEGVEIDFDSFVFDAGAVTLTTTRVACRVRNSAWNVVYADRISPSIRMETCIPRALDASIATCGVLNVRTGEIQTFSMADRGPLRVAMNLDPPPDDDADADESQRGE